jgi:hypothetical protein
MRKFSRDAERSIASRSANAPNPTEETQALITQADALFRGGATCSLRAWRRGTS